MSFIGQCRQGSIVIVVSIVSRAHTAVLMSVGDGADCWRVRACVRAVCALMLIVTASACCCAAVEGIGPDSVHSHKFSCIARMIFDVLV